MVNKVWSKWRKKMSKHTMTINVHNIVIYIYIYSHAEMLVRYHGCMIRREKNKNKIIIYVF